MALHADEPPIDLALVERLVAAQFPQHAGHPIAEFDSQGTTNAIYRIGAHLTARLPRRADGASEMRKSFAWLPRLAPHLPVKTPVPLALGEPGEGYPWAWSLVAWLDGENAERDDLPDPTQAACDLAAFLTALQSIDATGGPLATDHALRSAPLAHADEEMLGCIPKLPEDIDQDAVRSVWRDALHLPAWDDAPLWSHGDMSPGNLLWRDGRLSAVIDYGSLAVGDPACDLMIAWSLFEREGRRRFREAMGADDALWLRGRAHALAQAVIYIPYYLHTRPRGVAAARTVVDEVLADAGLRA